MKTSEAPEKIYIDIGHSYNGRWYQINPLGKSIEYTRTDAFIEMARKWFEKQQELYDANGVRVYGEEDFEDFKNYMKGE